jgi:hypothetical protein
MKQVRQAEALDDIISAHQNFLLTVKAGALLDDNSRVCYFHNNLNNEGFSGSASATTLITN